MILIQSLLLSNSVFLLFVVLYLEQPVTANPAKVDNCVGKRTCQECIQTKSCAWCLQPNMNDTPRCFQSVRAEFCQKDFTWNPQSTQEFIINRKLTATGSVRSRKQQNDNIVQISPQRVFLKLRINEIYSLPVHYSQDKDYPVDLYYLMDLSKSMEDDKQKLSALGDLLSETMSNITSNFHVGFGSFVDKVLQPFVSTWPENLIRPCLGCDAPYGFKNAMSLSPDTDQFATKIRSANISGNIDSPEGGMDAIMQATACRKVIGWREQARRLLVFSTDSGSHYAGDGKLGGVIAPNDGECHLNLDGLYTHSEVQDYPSIAQINRKVKENAINIIFAVTASHLSVYEKLSKHIEGSSTATLSADSSNVVDLVKEEYNKISSSIEMKDNTTSHVKIIYYSNCLNDGPEVPSPKCDGLKVGDVVKFTAQILVTSCPSDPAEWNQVIQIYPVGINESLFINLEMQCSCPCEKFGSKGYQENSSTCNNHGTLMCGICECNDLYFGRNCECSAVDSYSKNGKEIGCRADNMTTMDCNSRGHCLCGVCECEKRSNPDEIVSGRYCECDNFSCDRHDQQLCSGNDHGVCECGTCVCKPDWTGAACDCRVSNDTCISPQTGEICSGHGKCECGVCKCKSTKDGRYSGEFCEKCSTCSSRCHELRYCVQCQIYKTGSLKDDVDCSLNCTAFTTEIIEKVEINEEDDENICIFYDENDCKFTFKYRENKEIVEVYAESKLACPAVVPTLEIVLSVIASIVFLGLVTLLIWKVITTFHDKREFAKFEKERMDAKWNVGGNPIFAPATTTFENPTYSPK